MPGTDRRTFLKAAGLGAAALAAPRWISGAGERRPNIVFIITDQQHAGMMSCAGNRWLKTPALDRLAASGVRFERAYTTNPVCLPARFAFFTGHYPSKVGIGQNSDGRKGAPKEFAQNAMGWLFRKAGYETVYGGKVHLPRGMSPEQIGFRPLSGDRRGGLADACAKFLKGKHERPFLLVASFINPHDICYMAINAFRRLSGQQPIGNQDSRICEGLLAEPRKDLDAFVEKHCPPLPPNYAVPADEPEAITEKYLKVRPFRLRAREHWAEASWRLHRWAYCRLTEMVDKHVGTLLDALRDAGLEGDTLVVFTSDHGDHDASHKLEHKSVLYEEAANIPLLMRWPSVLPAGRVDREHLVSNGLDLIPTLCDAGGIAPPEGLLGRSALPVAKGETVHWRDHLVVETKCGRMLRSARHKYIVYESGHHREQLFDLAADPHETRSLAEEPRHQAALEKHRRLLSAWVAETNDAIARKYIIG